MNETEPFNNSDNILYVDVGNSLIKLKKYFSGRWENIYQIKHNELKVLADYFGEHSARFDHIVISSVVDAVTNNLQTIFEPFPLKIIKTSEIPANLLNYQTPETLGIDRFLACYGARRKTKSAVVVIDAGTACTIDFMDENDVFQGGVIMPGLRIMEEGLHQFAPALPKVEREKPSVWPGKSTKSALQWGITGVFLDALYAMLKRYDDHYGSFELWLTGGDALLLTEYFDNNAKIDQDLVFEGMRRFVFQ